MTEAAIFGELAVEQVEKPQPTGAGGDQSYREVLPYIEQAVETGTALAITVPNDLANRLKFALRKAGNNRDGDREQVTVRFGKDQQKGKTKTVVTFWTTEKQRRPRGNGDQAAEQAAETAEQAGEQAAETAEQAPGEFS